jgi:hypothetical protein
MTSTRDLPQLSRRGRGDEGTAVVEFALIAPFLVLVMMGMVEFGFLFRQENLFAGAVQGTARIASQATNKEQADQLALSGLYAQIQSIQRFTIRYVIIYNASDANGALPSGCLPANHKTVLPTPPQGVAGQCNVYGNAQVTSAGTTSGNPLPDAPGFTNTCASSATDYDHFWCPTARKIKLIDPPDWVGVYVEADYQYLTKLLGSSRVISDQTVFREEASLG